MNWGLYLPEQWINDPVRRKEAGVPEEITFKTKPELALDLIDEVKGWGLQGRLVLADAVYGDGFEFRQGLRSRGLDYVVQVSGDLMAWTEDPHPAEPPMKRGGQVPRKRFYAHDFPPARSLYQIARALPSRSGKTVLDDYSRLILYAALVKKETTWTHILALPTVILRYGLPHGYYVDSHSIFRFVQGRDSLGRKHHLLTDEATPQWKQVLDDCNVKVTYALSPQAKGKMERPYGWLQDRLVRICVREDITDIKPAQQILRQEIHRYNYRQIHSTTQEIPYFRFQRALKEKRSLFREFKIRPPYKSVKDILSLRTDRIVDPYRHISVSPLQFKVHADPHRQVNLRIYPLNDEISEIRFWCEGELVDTQKVKNSELKGVHS